MFVFFKQKTAYEMRISDWSSDVCSSDLPGTGGRPSTVLRQLHRRLETAAHERHRRAQPDQRSQRHLEAELQGFDDDRQPDGRKHPDPGQGHPAATVLHKRKSDVEGTSVSVGVDLGGRRIIKKKKK